MKVHEIMKRLVCVSDVYNQLDRMHNRVERVSKQRAVERMYRRFDGLSTKEDREFEREALQRMKKRFSR